MVPAPLVHPDLAALVALSVAHEQRAAALVEIRLGERERLLDSQPAPPENDDQAAQAVTVDVLSSRANDGDDFLDARRSAG